MSVAVLTLTRKKVLRDGTKTNKQKRMVNKQWAVKKVKGTKAGV